MTNATDEKLDVDRWTREGHAHFKRTIRFKVQKSPDHAVQMMTWDEWMHWQKTRDPLNDDPERAEKVRKELEEARRGPGMSRRTPPFVAKKSAHPARSQKKAPPAGKETT